MTGRYQWLVVLTSAWLVAGGWLDAWAHHKTALETFFTPWHLVLYSGFVAAAAVVVAPVVVRALRRSSEAPAMPPGHRVSLLGVLLFALGGVGDALWHAAFGIEVGVEALLSPTHLMIGAGTALIASGPARAAWHRGTTAATVGWRELAPPLLSVGMVLSLATFFTAYISPLSIPLAAGERIARLADFGLGPEDFDGSDFMQQALGIAGVLLLATLIAGASLAVLANWPHRFGALTLLLVVGLAPSLAPHEVATFVPVVAGAGVAFDVLARLVRPAPDRGAAWRTFAFLGPSIFFGSYFGAVGLTVGLAWSPELWSGSILMAGSLGLGLSFLLAGVTP